MSIYETDRASSLDLGEDEAIAHKDTPEGEEQGIGRGEERQPDEVAGGQDQDEAPAAAPTAANAKTLFGMKRSNPAVKKGNDSYDYEQKYPEDAPYEEAAPAARVWRTYEDESRNHDANMVEESRDNVDVLLVFAGLFSAVVTTFVVQTSQNLQPDYAAMSASLLYESVLVQRAIANGSPLTAIPPSPLNPTIAFVPATTDVWVNALWFTSLFLSLTTAFVAVLVKQWLHHYVALPSGTPRDRSLTRQFRYAGFEKWHVQVIIGLLPVLIHLALAIFLSGLVVFLQPLRAALSWIICAGTVLVYTAYVVATILPIHFPQCPYRTPLCDLVHVSLCRIIPRVTWYDKEDSENEDRQWISPIFRYLPRVQARTPQSLATIESEVVRQTSTNLAAEALHWLFKASSNPTVQSIVIQSIGGLPMASEKMFLELQGDSEANTWWLKKSLLGHCLLETRVSNSTCYEPVPGMELKLGRLLRFDPGYLCRSFIYTPGIYSFELTAAIISNHCTLHDRETLKQSVSPRTFLMDNIRSSKLPPCGWYHLMKSPRVFCPLDPDDDSHANTFPLHLCSAILHSFKESKTPKRDFNSPLVLNFKDALPFFLEHIYNDIVLMFSKFVDPSIDKLPLRQRVFVAAIKFLLHRLTLPDLPDVSNNDIHNSISAALLYIQRSRSSEEATVFIPVLEDIMLPCVVPPFNTSPHWNSVFWYTIDPYLSLAAVAPSACSLRGPQSVVDLMTSRWDEENKVDSDVACGVLSDLLSKHVPAAYTVFRKRCLRFLGSHVFHGASVSMVSTYIAGILDGAVDDATLRLHIDDLCNPHNRFAACSILATHDISSIDRTTIHRDITTLVRLCPTRDAAWDECCRRLHDLVQSDGGDFFMKQRAVFDGRLPLRADEIQVEKENIKYAIQVLDDCFNGRATMDPVPSDSSPVPHAAGRIDRFVGWCRRRKLDGKQEEKQEV